MSDHPTTAIRAGDVGSEGRSDQIAELILREIPGASDWPNLVEDAAKKIVALAAAPSQDRAGDGGDLGELERLSEAATQGEWTLPHLSMDIRSGKRTVAMASPRGDGNGLNDRAFIVALVNAYRSGKLLPSIQGLRGSGTGETHKGSGSREPGPSVPARGFDPSREAVEMMAEHLHEEEGNDRAWRWPEHADDDGYRGNGGYVTITPTDVQCRLREMARRVLIRAAQINARLTPPSSSQATAIPSRGRFIDGVEDLPSEEDMTERGMSALPDSIRYDIAREARNLVNVFVPDAPPALLQGIKAALFRAEKRRIADLKRERASGFAAAIPSGGKAVRTELASFTDGNGVRVSPPDEVQYKFGCRHGELVDVFSDGDAFVRFFDNPNRTETVKWHHLCGVPVEHRVGRLLASADGDPQGEDAGAAESRSDASAVGRKAETPEPRIEAALRTLSENGEVR